MKSTFPKISYLQWKQSAQTTLKGADFDKALIAETYEGIRIKPIYTEAAMMTDNQYPGDYPYLRGTSQSGCNKEPRAVCTKAEFNSAFNVSARKVLSDSDAALIITFPDGFSEDDFAKLNERDFQKAFEGICLAKNRISFEPSIFADLIFDKFTKYCREMNKSENNVDNTIEDNTIEDNAIEDNAIEDNAIALNIEFDCFGYLLINGGMPYGLDIYYNRIADVINAANEGPCIKTIAINSIVFNSAGANAVQELAFAIATGVDIVRELLKRNIDINRIANTVRFHFSVSTNFFMEIAKFRAARLLWAKIIKEFGGDSDSQKISIHAETTTINKTDSDPHTNLLRGTCEAMAAVLGGAGSIYVHRYTNTAAKAEFAERIARNTLRVIRDESHISDTIDPPGGSYYIESLTADLANRAWKMFQEIEERGGMIKAMSDGIPQSRIEEVAAKRQENFRNGSDVLIGVNKYLNLKNSEGKLPDSSDDNHHNIIINNNSNNHQTALKPLIPMILEDLFNKGN